MSAMEARPVSTEAPIAGDPDWYKDAIIYELHVKAFYDSTGDGTGDFAGLMEKLDYIADLGVTAIWLLPFYPSPMRDDGYDIADYLSVHPDYGTLRDFRGFVREAHRRGLRVVTELVVNHTSEQHPWFVESRSSADGAKKDWYVWSDTDQRYKDERHPGRMLLAEANQWPSDVRPYFGDGDECHMAFHFPAMPRIWIALRKEDSWPIIDIMEQTPAIPENCQWALFLRNHDELTLEMVTDDERDYMWNEYAIDPRSRINLGIRRRLAPLVDNSRRRIELLTSLLLSLHGTPVIYYGDEIGMGDNIYLGDRNGVRTPMQWNGDRNSGFSRADVHALYTPLVADPVYGYQAVNVEAQQRVPGSLLNWMKRIIRVRKSYSVFGRGSQTFLRPENRRVLAYLREHDGIEILCVANLSRFAQYVELDLSRFAGRTPVELIGRVHFPKIGDLPYLLTLGPHDFLWFELT